MQPSLRDTDINAAIKVLKSGMLVQGKEVEGFEKNFSKYIGVKYAIAVSSGTAALHLALLVLGIKKGDEVIVPAFSFVATANVVELVGAKPVFVDINLETFNINTTLIQKAITKKTKAIIPVHEFGLPADMLAIRKIAKANNIPIIEDAACALGAYENKKHVGSFGNITAFSLHPRKAITSGEGGILTTNDSKVADKLKVLRNHGIKIIKSKMEFVEAGYNYRMTNFQAALVNSQLNRIQTQLIKKNNLSKIYLNNITNKKIKLPSVPSGKEHSWQTFHILLDKSINRNELIKYLHTKNIGTNNGAQCIPAQIFYQKKYTLDCLKHFPNAMFAYKQGLALPLYEKLSKQQVIYISNTLNSI